jgi:hypothetical protein
MSSLSVHLRLPEDHSGLPFHPSCPVCRRDRLAGSLDGDEIVSRRTQAAIAAGLLAFSGVGAPAAAVAAGPDQEIEGSAEVVGGPDPEADVDETTPGWTDGGAAPTEDDLSEPEDVSPELVPREVAEEPVNEVADEVEDPDSVTEPETGPVAIAAPPTEDPMPTTEPAAPDGIRVDTAERAKRERPVKHAKPVVQPRVVVAAPAPVVATTTTTTTAATVRVVAGTDQDTFAPAESDARFHVVLRGESLWSIATERLGGHAATAEIAREVDRLWQLNEDRVASGDPDLLYTGLRLRLR